MSTEPADAKPDPAEERVLIERIAQGDGDALARLYDRYAPLLITLARRILHRDGEAEEVLQEVLLQVWKQAHRYQKHKSSVTTWLVLLTRSRAIDRLRSRQSRDRTLSAFKLEYSGQGKDHASATAAGNVLLKERRLRLDAALEDLPAEQRQVLELAFYSGMSQSEIAAAVQIPLGTVKTRTLLAMRKLRKALEGEMKELL